MSSPSAPTSTPTRWLAVPLVAGFVGGLVLALRAEVDTSEIPGLDDVLPWWLVVAVGTFGAVLALVRTVAPWTSDGNQVTAFRLALMLLTPPVKYAGVGAAYGLVCGWAGRVGAGNDGGKTLVTVVVALLVTAGVLIALVRWARSHTEDVKACCLLLDPDAKVDAATQPQR